MKVVLNLMFWIWMVGITIFTSCSDETLPTLPAPVVETPDIGDRQELKELHVDGRYLKDAEGNIVNLHGVAQTYSPFFNNNAWGNYDVDGCLRYNQLLLDKVLAAGWEINFVRQHMDPYWSSPGAPSEAEAYAYYDEERFKKYLDIVFVPMAEFAISRGCYVIMRPPGVSPENIRIGDDYQKYLIRIWNIVSQHPKLKNNSFVMFELANEPVNIVDKETGSSLDTNSGYQQLTEYFQEIVDTIRTNCNNIIWVPGLGYQSQYAGYATYPIKDELNNYGFAIHVYPGWYGSDGENEDGGVGTGGGYTAFQNGWDNQVGPVAATHPIVVTEMDWAPAKYNASWGKALTGEAGGSGFGANFKLIVDNSGNVSWLLFTGLEYLADFVDEPGKEGEYTFLNDPEACPWPIYHWYQEYAGVSSEDYGNLTDITLKGASKDENGNYSMTLSTGNTFYLVPTGVYDSGKTRVLSGVTYSSSAPDVVEITESGKINALKDGSAVLTITYGEWVIEVKVDVTMFPLTSESFNPSIWESGTFDEATHTLITGPYGFGGWEYSNGLDLSAYRYLVAELDVEKTSSSASPSFRIFDQGYWNGCAPFNFDLSKSNKAVADLQNLHKENTFEYMDPHSLKIIGFWTNGGQPVVINRVYATNEWPFADLTDISVEWPTNLAVGGQSAVNATATFADGTSRNITYEADYVSDNPNVISVNNKGFLTGVNEGKANVTISFGPEGKKMTKTQSFTVVGGAKSLSVKNLPSEILTGSEVNFLVYAQFENGSELPFTDAVTYKSSNESVLSVTGEGKVKAVSSGSAKLTISYMGTKLVKSIEVINNVNNVFSFAGGYFNPVITGTSEYDYETGQLKMTNSGLIGWSYSTALNLRAQGHYLVAELSEDSGDCWFVIGNGGAYDPCYCTSSGDMKTVNGHRYIVVDTSKDYEENGYNHGTKMIDLTSVKMIALQSYGSTITIQKIYASDTDPTASK